MLLNHFQKLILTSFFFYLCLKPSYLIRFRSPNFCLPAESLEAKPDIDLSDLNTATWEIKYHLRSKRHPINPFYNVFYPENDLSCLTFRTRFMRNKGTFDISCGYSECRIATFASNLITPGKFMLHPYADNADCSGVTSWKEFRIIDGDPERYLLLYCCYIQEGRKVEGGFLLSRAGLNLSQAFYKKVLRPLTLIANTKDFIVSDMENMASCNCTDYCSYYEIRTTCHKDEESECEFEIDYFYYFIGIVGTLVVIIVMLVVYLCMKREVPFKIE